MPRSLTKLNLLVIIFISFLLLVTACSPAPAAQPAEATLVYPTTTPIPPTDTPASPTVTPEPTATATATPVPPTETPLPTPTQALALLENGISGFCYPAGMLVNEVSDPLAPPENARIGQYAEDGTFEVRNLPWTACVFNYTFNQPVPAGLTLEVYDLNQAKPWLQSPLTAVSGRPEVVTTLLRHTYIIEPPFWSIVYEFVVKDATGVELYRSPVTLRRWETGLCWQGNLPPVDTLYCPLQQDLHPWDVGYGKPLPTVTPDGD